MQENRGNQESRIIHALIIQIITIRKYICTPSMFIGPSFLEKMLRGPR